MDYLSELNQKQKEAVLATDGPVLVIAGAGAGKTKMLTHRILHLIISGVKSDKILAITFTNKAAKEMRERISSLLKKHGRHLNENPFVSTFHALGVYIIKENSAFFGLPRNFSIFDKADSKKAIKEAFQKVGEDPKEHLDKVSNIISKEKGRGKTVEEYLAHGAYDFTSELTKKIWTEYEQILKKSKALDFDDLLLKTLKLLKNRPEILNHYRKKFEYIHIDEYQDTNGVQNEIAEILAGENKNICVVGDVDQNIYGWRGAEIKNMLHFEKTFQGTKTFLLEQNYRSTKVILDAANEIIKKNMVRVPKNLFTENDFGEKISVLKTFNELDEAVTIASKCKDLVDNGTEADQIAVLFRTNFQSRALEEGFLAVGLHYQMLGTKFFERKEIKDVIAFIRLSLDNENLSDFERIVNIPPRGFGKVTIEKIKNGHEEDMSLSLKIKLQKFKEMISEFKTILETNILSSAIKIIIEKSGIEKMYLEKSNEEDLERLENIHELVSLATELDELSSKEPLLALEKFLTDVSLHSDQDDLTENKKGVRLMTIHASKGLEFDQVFITGLEQGLFPHNFPNERKNTEEREEERRLFYVALTRARKKLYLSWTEARKIFGVTTVNIPSEFLSDIPEELLEDGFYNEPVIE